MTEFASETTCSANESPCTKSRATEGVSFQADAEPAHSFLDTLRPTKCTETSLPNNEIDIVTLEVITVIWRICSACSGSRATTWLISELSLAANCRALLSFGKRQYGLVVPK